MLTLPQILNLARAGALAQAWAAFEAGGYDRAEGNIAALTLKGRLLKDNARGATGAKERAQYYAASADAYLDAAAIKADSYPLINAAAMALLAGDSVRAMSLATQVLGLLDSGADSGETPYWQAATRAEALLLLGRIDEAKANLACAIKRAPLAFEDRAATIRQFRLILSTLEQNSDWLQQYAPAPIIAYRGIMDIDGSDVTLNERIAAEIAALSPAMGVGALAAGADILVAEALCEIGAALHIVLPCATDTFRATSVQPYGGDWSNRFDRLISYADHVENLDITNLSHAAIALANNMAMGYALDRAKRWETYAVSVHISDKPQAQTDNIWSKADGMTLHIPAHRATNSKTASLPDNAQISIYLASQQISPNGTVQDYNIIQYFDVAKAIAAMYAVCESEGKCAITFGIYQNAHEEAQAQLLTARLAKSAGEKQIVTNKAAAFSIALTNPYIDIEPMGEISDNTYDYEIFSLRIRPI